MEKLLSWLLPVLGGGWAGWVEGTGVPRLSAIVPEDSPWERKGQQVPTGSSLLLASVAPLGVNYPPSRRPLHGPGEVLGLEDLIPRGDRAAPVGSGEKHGAVSQDTRWCPWQVV